MLLTADLPERVPLGGLAVANVAIINDDATAVTVSTRLHLHEGDLWVEVDGVPQHGVEQADTQARLVTLAPGEAVGSGVALVATDRGVMFDQPGGTTVSFVYGTPLVGRLRTAPGTIEVDHGSAMFDELTAADVSRGQVEVGSFDGSELVQIVAAASAVRAGGWPDRSVGVARAWLERTLATLSPADVGWTVTALVPPAPDPDDVLFEIARPLVVESELASAVLAGRPFARSLLAG